MKIKTLSAALLTAGFAVISAHAEWGKGLGHEYKNPLIPLQQQSGWGVKIETEAAPVAAKKKPKDLSKTVEAPAAAATDAPKQAKAIPEGKWVLAGVQFETGSDTIKPESQSTLNEAADILKTHARVVVEIQGHTDNVGDDKSNQELSQKRAVAVRQYLVGKGVEEKRMEARGYGESQPTADNNTADGRAKNRRIEFNVLSR